jgi:hypothetical protein
MDSKLSGEFAENEGDDPDNQILPYQYQDPPIGEESPLRQV